MAFNILDMIGEQITPENINTITRFLGDGEDTSTITKAVTTAAPLLLGGILDSTSRSEGKDLFNKTIDQADPGLFGNLVGALDGSAGNSLAATGISMLGSLFGNNKLDLLTKAISGFSGLSSGSSKSLLGVAGPMLMSMLSRKKQDDGLDNNGLLSMLADQKNNIANAITPEMSKSFSGSGLLDGLMDQAGDSVKEAAQSVNDTAQQAASGSRPLFVKFLPFFTFAILGLLLWFFISQSNQQPIESAITESAPVVVAPVTNPDTTVEIVEEILTVGDVDLEQSLTVVFDKTKEVLSSVTDSESANMAVNGMAEINQNLDSVLSLADQLSPAGKEALAETTTSMSSGLDAIIGQVYKVPGAGSILGESINSLRQKLLVLTSLQ